MEDFSDNLTIRQVESMELPKKSLLHPDRCGTDAREDNRDGEYSQLMSLTLWITGFNRVLMMLKAWSFRGLSCRDISSFGISHLGASLGCVNAFFSLLHAYSFSFKLKSTYT